MFIVEELLQGNLIQRTSILFLRYHKKLPAFYMFFCLSGSYFISFLLLFPYSVLNYCLFQGELINLPAGTEQKIRIELNGKVIGEKTGTVKKGEGLLMVFGAAVDKKFLIPITLGGSIALGGSVGFTYMISQNLWAGANIGMGYFIDAGQAVFMFDVNVFFPIIRFDDFMAGAGVAWIAFLPGGIFTFDPAVEISASYGPVFLTIGTRYSLAAVDGGFKPILGVGFRF
jgi:hypothetical protein